MELTTEQQAILAEQNGCMRVLAAAGSGKTTTMALYVKKQIDRRICREDQIGFITFTRFAAKEIREKVRKVVGRHVNMLTGTFHAMMYRLLNQAGIVAEFPEKLYDARMELWVSAFIKLVEEQDPRLVSVLKRLNLLVVDEFQDLDETQFRFLVLYKKLHPALRIVAIGDLAQNIYRFRGTSNEFLRTGIQKEIDPDLKTFALTTNFRSSKSILNFVNRVFSAEIEAGHILPMVAPASAPVGSKPKYYEFAVSPGKGMGEYEELVAETLLPVIKRAKKNNKSIVLIFPVLKCQSFEMVTALLRDYSRKLGYAFDLHQIAKEDETSITVEYGYNPRDPSAPVQFSSFHSSKGLEWDIVAIINMDNSLFTIRGEEDDSEAHFAEKTNLSYVGTTRPIEELYIFANASFGGRHHHLAHLGDALSEVADVTLWGETIREQNEGAKKPIALTELIRRLPQHADLYERIRKCSEYIEHDSKEGVPVKRLDIYEEMKKRNRERAFGTYIDWKLKECMCIGKTKCFQERLLELLSFLKDKRWKIPKREAYEAIDLRKIKIEIDFLNYNFTPSEGVDQYISASRILALANSRHFGMVDAFKEINMQVEKIIIKAATAKERTMRDEYILSQTRDFYVRGTYKEIQSMTAPSHLYQGMPCDFETFIIENSENACDAVQDCLNSIDADGELRGDVCLETESLIMGEADMVDDSAGGVLIEIKCGTAVKAVDLRDAGSCKHLLQVLGYVAMGRHGTIPLKCEWAFLVNPLTGAWERYNLKTWSMEQSAEFYACLEELRERA